MNNLCNIINILFFFCHFKMGIDGNWQPFIHHQRHIFSSIRVEWYRLTSGERNKGKYQVTTILKLCTIKTIEDTMRAYTPVIAVHCTLYNKHWCSSVEYWTCINCSIPLVLSKSNAINFVQCSCYCNHFESACDIQFGSVRFSNQKCQVCFVHFSGSHDFTNSHSEMRHRSYWIPTFVRFFLSFSADSRFIITFRYVNGFVTKARNISFKCRIVHCELCVTRLCFTVNLEKKKKKSIECIRAYRIRKYIIRLYFYYYFSTYQLDLSFFLSFFFLFLFHLLNINRFIHGIQPHNFNKKKRKEEQKHYQWGP